MTDIDLIKATPGSDLALKNGCTCPVRDNGHGRGYMSIADQYWIDSLCPIHSDIEDDEPRSEPGNGPAQEPVNTPVSLTRIDMGPVRDSEHSWAGPIWAERSGAHIKLL